MTSQQDKKIRFLFGAVAFVGGVSALITFFFTMKNRKLQREILAIDRELKLHQLNQQREGSGLPPVKDED